MNKKLPISLLSLFAMFGMAGCGNSTDTGNTEKPADTTKTSDTADQVKVEKVAITLKDDSALTEDDLTVLDGTSVTLKATVTGSKAGLKVDWSSSDEAVAKVTNGVVRFLSVSETKDVTITATSRDDKTKSTSVTFHVKHSMIDFSTSRANNLDSSLFLTEGKITTDPGDVALVYADVYSTKWYVQADITYTGYSDGDNYPKFGIMSGNKAGIWNMTTESDVCYNNFLYLDAMNPSSSNSWNTFNMVGQTDAMNNWSWGSQYGGFSSTVNNGETYTLGLLRDGTDYYQFFSKPKEDGTAGEIVAMKHIVDNHIPADMATYAWVGGWSTGVEVSNFIAYSNDEVDQMYKTPTDLSVTGDGTTLFINDTYQINVSTEFINYDKNKLHFVSSDETVATVDANGLVTAKNKAGDVKITVTYGDTLTKELHFTVTDDEHYKVDLDGEMNDLLWTDTVKKNKIHMDLNGAGESIDIYGSMNSRGVYLYADLTVNSKKNDEAHNDWWENDNFEGRFFDTATNSLINSMNPDKNDGQFWISGNKTSNFEKFYVSDATATEDGKYNIKFETFTSFDRINQGRTEDLFSQNSKIGAYFGTNPASGWKAMSSWENYNAAPRLTINGFEQANGQTCAEGNHDYTDWKVTKENTCGEDGSKQRSCKMCGKVETEVIAKDENAHVFDYDNATVKTASTCNTKGVGEATCTKCGKKIETELPLDPTNHASEYNTTKGVYDCCGETIKLGETKSVNATAWNLNVSRLVMDGTTDFSVEYDLHVDGNDSTNDAGSNWIVDLSSANKNADGTYAEWANGGMTCTADWNAWGANCDKHEVTDTTQMPSDWFNQGYMKFYKNMDAHLSLKYENGIIDITGTYTFLGDGAGHQMSVHYTSTAFTVKNYMVLNFGGQKCNITYKSVKVTSGTLIEQTTK